MDRQQLKVWPPLWVSLLPLALLSGLLILTVRKYGADASSGPNQAALIFSGLAAAALARIRGLHWAEIEEQLIRSVGYVTQAIVILLLVGALIGSWMLGGVAPTLIDIGISALNVRAFPVTAFLVAAGASLATGSSWSTAGTLGVALMGVGATLGVDPALAAGAIVSGAYFGDKMSPFSDTTNLASSMAGVPLFTHIRHMIWTTGPASLATLAALAILGLNASSHGAEDLQRIEAMRAAIAFRFDTQLWNLWPVALVIALSLRRVPAIPALALGTLAGLLNAGILQHRAWDYSAGLPGLATAALQAAASGFRYEGPDAMARDLLSRGGMASMLSTIWLILSAMVFSSVMEASGMLARVAYAVIQVARGTGNLIAATLGTAVLLNATASEQYLSIVLTGRMYASAYQQAGLAPKNLSRALEDSGTLSSALIPWNTCGAFMQGALGVSAIAYGPFAILNWLNPLLSAIYGYTGFTIEKLEAKLDNSESKPQWRDRRDLNPRPPV
ncbi:MAG: Na+/H+ antiporter NhaC [Leptospirales bacterium]|nr:Na+/H+ antiporter NhaC [Leptospirales bacterium]